MQMCVCVCVAVISEPFEEENCNGSASDEEPETQSTCSLSSNSAPVDVPCTYIPSCSPSYPLLLSSCPFPSSLPSFSPCTRGVELPSPGSLEGFGRVSPVLGPRSECSGASSPECEQERGKHQATFLFIMYLYVQIHTVLTLCVASGYWQRSV